MKLLICLLLVGIAMCDDGHPVVLQKYAEVEMKEHSIPENPYLKGVRAHESFIITQWFQELTWQREITEDDHIRIDYTIQVLDTHWYGNTWEHGLDDSVYLCEPDSKTQNGTMLSLIRYLLRIPRGCPVKPHVNTEVKDVRIPFFHDFYWNLNTRDNHIRVLFNVWDDLTPHSRLLTGDVYPNCGYKTEYVDP